MAIYFVDPYKKYYDKLNVASGLSASSSKVQERASFLVSSASRLSTQVGAAAWLEKGQKEIVSSTLPSLSKGVQSLSDGITSSLVVAVDMAVNQLLPTVTELKANDELYEKYLNELNSLVEPSPRYETRRVSLFSKETETVETEAYKQYVAEKTRLETEVAKYKKLCEDGVAKADGIATSINGLSSSLVTIKATGASMDGENYAGSKIYYLTADMEVSRTNTLINYGEYYVVNTAYPVIDYYNHIQKYGIYQEATTDYRNKCLGVSYLYARDLTVGSAKKDMDSAYAGAETWYTMTNSPEEQTALDIVYREITAGRPVAMNVKGPTYRHWVTVVGFKTDVTSAADLKAEDLLILDSWDGKVERMDCEDSRVFIDGKNCGHPNYDWRIDVLKTERYAKIGTGGYTTSANA